MTGRLITDHSSPIEVSNGANDLFGTPELAPSPRDDTAFGTRASSVSGLGAFAAIGAAVMCLAFSPKVSSATFTPKFAVLLLFAAVGVVALFRVAGAHSSLRWPARAAVAFLCISLISALVSPSPNIGFFGLFAWGTGWLFWLGVAGSFAIGACLGPNDRRWLFAGLLAGALGSALLAVYQILVNPQIAGLTLYDGKQADAALGNPIHLEALLLGALALILGRTCRAPRRWAAAVVLLALGLELTFERFAIVVLIGLVLYALYSYGVRRGGIFALLVAAGYAIGYLTRGSGLSARVVSGTSETTFGTRLRIWYEGAHYVLHHPLLGAGPGQTRTAFDSTATLSFFQHVLVGRVLTDSHDIFVEVAVTTGLVGLVCFLVWLFGAVRVAARCGFLGFAAAVVAVNLVEPLNVAVLPLAFLALGAATAARSPEGSLAVVAVPQGGSLPVSRAAVTSKRARLAVPWAAVSTFVALAVALIVGVTMIIGDAYMAHATAYRPGQLFNLSVAKSGDRLLPYWPDSALVVAEVEAYESFTPTAGSSGSLAGSRQATAEAVSRDSTSPHLWVLLGEADVELKAYGRARADYFRALSCDRWYTQAMQGLGQLGASEREWSQAIYWYRRALVTAVDDPVISASLKGSLIGAERHT